MNKERFLAFMDAIIVISATIMVLELAVPNMNDWQGLKESGLFLSRSLWILSSVLA
jgi:uncharacterized membrane protein